MSAAKSRSSDARGATPLHSVFFVSQPTFELGPQGRILRLARAWSARGHATAIASLQGDWTAGERERRYGDVRVEALTRRDKRILRAGRIDAALAVRRFVARERPKLVFALETLVDWHVKLGLVDRDVPIVTLLGIDRWKWERKFYRRAMFRVLARRSSALIGNSQSCLAGYRRALGADVVDPIAQAVVHNPVDPSEFTAVFDRGSSELAIGAIGRLAEQKGFDRLLRAFALLPREIGGRRLRLTIQGSGPQEESLRRLSRELAIGDRFELREHRKDVASFYASLAALAVPSRWAGFENSALEGIASGVPTICTPETGLIELECRGELWFSSGEPPALARTLTELLSKSDAERASIAKRQRAAIVAELDSNAIAAELERKLIQLGVPV